MEPRAHAAHFSNCDPRKHSHSFQRLVHGIIIRPAIEVGWLDILLAQQSGYLRTMINRVVDGLDQHDDDRSIIGPPVKIENP
jgi:hypothetical protein